MAPLVTRRTLMLTGLGMGAALAGALPVPALSSEAITVDQFLAVSARLTGTDVSGLDPDAAAKILQGLLSIGRGPGLALLAQDPDVDAGTVAEDIIAAWYSGTYETDSGQAVATFTGALIWNALDYTKPFGSCGGETGYWAEAPQS